jgi:hypothetical protein
VSECVYTRVYGRMCTQVRVLGFAEFFFFFFCVQSYVYERITSFFCSIRQPNPSDFISTCVSASSFSLPVPPSSCSAIALLATGVIDNEDSLSMMAMWMLVLLGFFIAACMYLPSLLNMAWRKFRHRNSTYEQDDGPSNREMESRAL